MISLILPYWLRQEATDKALCLMAEHYMDLDLEIIIVDDGSPTPYVEPTLLPLEIKVIRLAKKFEPLNPCVPYNRGVKESKGEYIALSNPEILHRTPILEEMQDSIKGGNDYVLAAAWSAEQNRWHAHSSLKKIEAGLTMPAQYHFMSMMKKSLWDKVGGFDEDYRKGAGFDDPDFVMRLENAGANFIHRDDLVVEHPREGAKTIWTNGTRNSNRELFSRKWS